MTPDAEPALRVVPQGGPQAVESDSLLAAARSHFQLYARADLDTLPPPEPLIAGLLPRRGVAMLAGSRGLGKSLLTLSAAGAIATGLPTWAGKDVARPGPVLYCALEGFHGVPARVRAWETFYERRAEGITWLSGPIDLKRGTEARMLGLLARDLGAVAVFVDSARATGAGKEDTADMGEFVRGLESVAATVDGLVMVLHNTGWDQSRERGSTLLPDACDTTLLLEGDPEGLRTLRHRKHRDGDMLETPLAFRFRKIEDTGSGVLIPADASSGITMQERVLAVVGDWPGLSTGDYLARLGMPKSQRPNVSRHLNTLAQQGVIVNVGSKTRPVWHARNDEPRPGVP